MQSFSKLLKIYVGKKKSPFYILKTSYTLLTWHLFQSAFKDSYVCEVAGVRQ